MSPTLNKTTYLFRRELWENRSGVIWAPVTIAAAGIALILLSLALGLDDFSRHVVDTVEWTDRPNGEAEETRVIDFSRGRIVVAEGEDLDRTLLGSRLLEMVNPSMHSIAVGFEFLALVVALFYLLGGLFNDRKDRTILFWKSLPFSETQAVLVKLVFAVVVIPVVALLAALAVQLVFGASMVLLIARTTDFGFGEILSEVGLFSVFFAHLFLVLVFAVKNLALFSWLMFASALSKRSPFLTAILPPVAIAALEALIFGSSYFLDFVGSLIWQGELDFSSGGLSVETLAPLAVITPLQLLKILGVSVPLVIAAIWLRNNRYEI